MFRSAARVYGAGLVGVVLSGALDDGSAGLAVIKSRGGSAVVQSPESAMFPDMPRNAIAATRVDHVVTAESMGELLHTLVGPRGARNPSREAPMSVESPSSQGTAGAAVNPGEHPPGAHDTPSPFTCPDCGGVLNFVVDEAGNPRFRCQVGHPWSPHALLAQQVEQVEGSLWAALRILVEHKRMNQRMLDTARNRNLVSVAGIYEQRLREAENHESRIRELITMPLTAIEPPGPVAQRDGNEGRPAARAKSGD
jgi:two-component system chemotaxis response regulator CheB